MGKVLRSLVLLLLFAGLANMALAPELVCMLFDRAWSGARAVPTEIKSTGPTVEELAKLSQLVTHRVQIADVMTAEDGSYRGAWIIKGDALITVDLANAEFLTLNDSEQRVTLRLPRPTIQSPRVDHERTVVWDIATTAWLPYRLWVGADPNAMVRDAMKNAQRVVEMIANSEEHLAEGRQRTELLIQGFYERVGWKVDIHWVEIDMQE